MTHLERMLDEESQRLAGARRELAALGMERAAESGEYSRRAETEHTAAVAHARELKEVRDAAAAAIESQQEAVARERGARAELAKVG